MPVHPLPELDPLAAAAGLAHADGTVLLHSQRDWHGSGRSWLLFDPVGELELRGGRLTQSPQLPLASRPATDPGARLEQLRGLLAPGAAEEIPLLAGYLGYESASRRLARPHPVAPPFGLPEAWIGVYDAAVAFGDPAGVRLITRADAPATRARELVERLGEAAACPRRRSGPSGPVRFFDREWHASAVAAIQAQLRAGESYQVNLTGFASAETGADPFEHFLNHSRQDPVAFASFLTVKGRSISSHSPERLLRIRGDRADTAPIKGTTAAGQGSRGRLRASEKDRAEHLMIVDLCRNDLGRRACDGSVEVAALMEALRVRNIDHLVSRIECRVRPGARGALLDSMFPGGSITGAPKRRSMEIIRDVELSGRGPYTGSIGFLTTGGDLDFSIAIRTAVWESGRVDFGCGGGIVIDSEPGPEFDEARLKARSFFDSLRDAVSS